MTSDQEILYIVKADNKNAIAQFEALRKTQEGVTAQTRRLTGSTQQGNMMLMSTSRIIQDMPFGFMAVGNNITFLAEQFAYAKTQGMGFKESLKGIGASLLGTGGVIFAISALTSYFTMMSRETSNAESYTKDFIETVIKGSSESEEFAKSLGMVNKALRDLTDETLKSRISDISNSLNSLFGTVGFMFNKEGFGQKVFGLSQLIGEQEQRRLRSELGLVGQEQGLIERLQTQIKLNTELRDGAQTLEEQTKYQKIINSLQSQLNTQLGIGKKEAKELLDFYKYINDIMDKEDIGEPTPLGDVLIPKRGFSPNAPASIGGAMAAYTEGYKKQLELVQNLTEDTANLMRMEFGSAWQDIFGEANSLFEKILMTWAARFGSDLIDAGANWLTSGFFGLLGGVLGFQPQTINVNMGNENVEKVVVKGLRGAQQKRLI